MKKTKQSNVYLIADELANYMKIGVANNIPKRLMELQIGCPYKLYLVSSISVNNAFSIENKLHKKFKHLRHRAEWFIFDYSIIEEFELLKIPNNCSIDNQSYIEQFMDKSLGFAYGNDHYYNYLFHCREVFRKPKEKRIPIYR